MSFPPFKTSFFSGLLILAAIGCWANSGAVQASGSFGFDVHNRYSDAVKDFLDADGLPEKGSLDYYAAVARRDRLFKARRLAAAAPLLTLSGSNETLRLSLGFLHYAVVHVGTPALEFLVALDTGSDLFWLPCDCTSCVRSLNTSSGSLDLNIYSPSTSSTGEPVACNSSTCGPNRGCATKRNACAYRENYLSSNTSSTGILVDDVLHLGTDENPQKNIEAPITLGCGITQTGDFLDGAAINGLFGLGMDNISVPSILANKGLAANSFSMCFGPDGIGRIDFGDKGSSSQRSTPFNIEQQHPTYNITVTQIAVENNVTNLEFTAIFDSGTSFTSLTDPAYSVIVDSFNAHITNEPRYHPPSQGIFDYCYALGATQNSYEIPNINLTMRGGDQFFLAAPTVVIPRQGGYAYCLAMVKSEDINIIGQNFMTGYRVVFDREDMVLGWTESDCYDSASSSTLPVNRSNPIGAPSPSVVLPEATPGNGVHPPISSISPTQRASLPRQLPSSPASGNNALSYMTIESVLMVIFSIFSYHVILSY